MKRSSRGGRIGRIHLLPSSSQAQVDLRQGNDDKRRRRIQRANGRLQQSSHSVIFVGSTACRVQGHLPFSPTRLILVGQVPAACEVDGARGEFLNFFQAESALIAFYLRLDNRGRLSRFYFILSLLFGWGRALLSLLEFTLKNVGRRSTSAKTSDYFGMHANAFSSHTKI